MESTGWKPSLEGRRIKIISSATTSTSVMEIVYSHFRKIANKMFPKSSTLLREGDSGENIVAYIGKLKMALFPAPLASYQKVPNALSHRQPF